MEKKDLMGLVNIVRNVTLNEKKKKLDPVDQDELDDKYKDREDKDIDNDGDTDSSDKYLHKRRKAISKNVEKNSKMKTAETGSSVDEAVSENRVLGSGPSQSMMDRFTASDKKFLATHGVSLMGQDSQIDGEKAAADTAAAIKASGKKGPMRPQDNDQGDKTPKLPTSEALQRFVKMLDEKAPKLKHKEDPVKASRRKDKELEKDKPRYTKGGEKDSRYKVNEEDTQLDEISQEKLRDYHAKAGADAMKAKDTVKKHMDAKKITKSGSEKASAAYKRYQKRAKGLNMASKKMKD